MRQPEGKELASAQHLVPAISPTSLMKAVGRRLLLGELERNALAT